MNIFRKTIAKAVGQQVTNDSTNLNLTSGSSPAVLVLGDLDQLLFFSSLPQILNEISGTSDNEPLIGTESNDIIRGFQGRDTLNGSGGNDVLVGGLDGDRLTGGQGRDQFVYDSFDERTDTIADFNVNEDMLVLTNLFAALNYNGIDPIADGYLQFVQDGSRTRVQVDPDSIQGAFPFTTIAILENVAATSLKAVVVNEIVATSSNDKLTGTSGNDIILGLEGADTLIGGAGDDLLVGGLNSDILTGGTGSDQFVYNSLDERTDRILDFNVNEDKLLLSNVLAGLNYNGIDPVADGYLQFVPQGLNTRVQINPEGVDGFFLLRTIAVLDKVSAADLVVGSNVII